MTGSVHTVPTRQDHVTTGLDCWCGPRYALPCDECGDDEDDGVPAGCWKCTDGLIDLTRDEAERADAGILIIHNDVNVEDSNLPMFQAGR